jgi:hypothetical protein
MNGWMVGVQIRRRDVAHHEENILRTIGTQAALPTYAGSAARLSKRNGQDVKFLKVV